MSNNTETGRFLMLTLVFTVAFMQVFGVVLLKWQMAHSFLYVYTLALNSTSLAGIDGLNTVFYTVTCLAVGAFAAWVFDIVLSLSGAAVHKVQIIRSETRWANHPASDDSTASHLKGAKK